MMKKKSTKIKLSWSEKVFYYTVALLAGCIALTMLYPLTFVVSASISSPQAVMSGQVLLWPIDITLKGYQAVIENKNVILGFRNSLFYMVVGTAINLVMTTLTAYPLSRKNLPGKGPIMFLFTFTMIFGAGMIPNYLLMKDLHLLNTVWVMLLPGAISTYNMIVMRTFFMTNIPDELLEASKLDGCSDFNFLCKVVLPLSKSIIAVIVMYYARQRLFQDREDSY